MVIQPEADWLIAYKDGSFLTSLDFTPEKVPRSGVICIIQRERSCGKRTLVQMNYFCWHKYGQWVPHDLSGLNQYLDDHNEPGIRLQGFWLPDEEYAEIVNKAMDDPRMPKKTASAPRLAEIGE